MSEQGTNWHGWARRAEAMIAVLAVKKTQMGGMVVVDSLRAYPDILGAIRIFSAVLVANSATNTALHCSNSALRPQCSVAWHWQPSPTSN